MFLCTGSYWWAELSDLCFHDSFTQLAPEIMPALDSFLCVCVLCLHVCVPHVCVPMEVISPGPGVTDGCEPSGRGYEANPSTLQRTTTALHRRTISPARTRILVLTMCELWAVFQDYPIALL